MGRRQGAARPRRAVLQQVAAAAPLMRRLPATQVSGRLQGGAPLVGGRFACRGSPQLPTAPSAALLVCTAEGALSKQQSSCTSDVPPQDYCQVDCPLFYTIFAAVYMPCGEQ